MEEERGGGGGGGRRGGGVFAVDVAVDVAVAVATATAAGEIACEQEDVTSSLQDCVIGWINERRTKRDCSGCKEEEKEKEIERLNSNHSSFLYCINALRWVAYVVMFQNLNGQNRTNYSPRKDIISLLR